MAQLTTSNNQSLKTLSKELAEVKKYLRKLLLIIPEESLDEYENSSEIKKNYQEATKAFPPER